MDYQAWLTGYLRGLGLDKSDAVDLAEQISGDYLASLELGDDESSEEIGREQASHYAIELTLDKTDC